MVTKDALDLSRKYISSLSDHGLSITRAILFGSFARGDFNENSDIDLLLISPEFDKNLDYYCGLIWKLTSVADYRIEPVPVGEEYFNTDTGSPIVEIAKQEGIELTLTAV